MRGTVVMATYNEAGSIRPVLAEIDEAAWVLRRAGIELEILLVDDSSPDGTAAIAAEEAARLGLRLEVITGTGGGIGRAQLQGFERALDDGTDFLVTLDADGQHDARQITDLVRAFLARGSGITIGSRWVRGGSAAGTPLLRVAASRVASWLVRRITGLRKVHDATTSFRVVKPEVAKLFPADDVRVEGYGFFSAFVAVAQAYGFTIDEVPIHFRPRYSGINSLSQRDVIDFWRSLFRVRDQVRSIRAEVRADQGQWAARSARMQEQTAELASTFGGHDELASLADADRFFGWIVSELDPHLGHSVLEVGAGIGTVALKIARQRPDREVTAIEPATNVFDQLVANTARQPNVTAHAVTSQVLAARDERLFDSVIYVNVLEHIRDDAAELRTAHRLLAPGGTLGIFVPAMPALYGSLDYKSGHYRRYDRDGLAALIRQGGFEIVDVRYFDVAGIVPYWLMYRVLDVQRLGSMSSGIYDRLIVPASRALQRFIPDPPVGKNLIAVARRR